ncbi:GNAT family N-acetyltransferase [Streptomyces sp. enrichment culture]|uniref:GNAT family N-acetyltransferase n=1 Tax=Streptomyces sp. enrichment culture TaxID=1795815 RepID=UPI003F57BE1C
MNTRIDVVRPREMTPEDLARWDELQAMVPGPAAANPFMSAHFARAVDGTRPDTRVAVVRRDGEPVAYFPYQRGRFGHGSALAMGVSDHQGAVVHPRESLDPRKLLEACSLSSWEFNHLSGEQRLFVPHATGRFTSPVIDLTPGFAHYEAELRSRSRSFLKGARAQERRLSRHLGPVRLVHDERDPDALSALLAWKSAHYRRTGRRDPFAQPWIDQLVRHLAITTHPECRGVLSVLYAGERPVAAHFGLRSRTVFCCWFPSYDRALATYSPGRILFLHMIEAAASSGIRLFDFGRGDAAYKDSFKTGHVSVHEGVLRRATPGAALHWVRREPARAAHRVVRRHPGLRSAVLRTMSAVGALRER